MQLTDTNGNELNICASAITGGSSYGSAVVLGSNFLRAWYTVYSVTTGTPQARPLNSAQCLVSNEFNACDGEDFRSCMWKISALMFVSVRWMIEKFPSVMVTGVLQMGFAPGIASSASATGGKRKLRAEEETPLFQRSYNSLQQPILSGQPEAVEATSGGGRRLQQDGQQPLFSRSHQSLKHAHRKWNSSHLTR